MSFREDLKAFIDGELPAGRTMEIERALEADPALAAEAEELRALTSVLRSVPQPEVRGYESTLIALSSAERAAPRRTWLPWFGSVALAGSVAMAILFVNRQPEATFQTVAMNTSERAAAPESADTMMDSAPLSANPVEGQEVAPESPGIVGQPKVNGPTRRSGPAKSNEPVARQEALAAPPGASDVIADAPPTTAAASAPAPKDDLELLVDNLT
jgi:hypothetical protein